MKQKAKLKHKLKQEDFLKLWLYFEDRATSIKGVMFNTITWVIGFAAALLAFTFANLVNFASSKAAVSLSTLMILVSGAGLVVCLYAFFALSESAKHTRNNWNYAQRCLNEIEGLSELVFPKKDDKKTRVVQIWRQLFIVVSLFVAAFIAILVWAFTI